MASVVTVTTRRRPAVQVVSGTRTTITAVMEPGPQGGTGPVGPPGLQAGFGSIDYADQDRDIPLDLPEGVWTRVLRNLSPSPSNRNLPSGPWAGFQFWRDGRLWARAEGDNYVLKFAFRVVPSQRGSSIKFGVWPNGEQAFDFAPGPIMIAADAGDEETSSATFFAQARSRLALFGAEIYALSSAGATLLEFSPEIAPFSYKP